MWRQLPKLHLSVADRTGIVVVLAVVFFSFLFFFFLSCVVTAQTSPFFTFTTDENGKFQTHPRHTGIIHRLADRHRATANTLNQACLLQAAAAAP